MVGWVGRGDGVGSIDGWAAATEWACIGLPSCFLFGHLVGWVGRGDGAPIHLPSSRMPSPPILLLHKNIAVCFNICFTASAGEATLDFNTFQLEPV